MGRSGLDWSDSLQGPVPVVVVTVRPSGCMKCGGFSSCARISLSRTTRFQEVIRREIEDISKCMQNNAINAKCGNCLSRM